MAFAWRNIFTYNRYAGIAARATRRALKENKRLEAERRNTSHVRVSKWKNGVQGEQVRLGTDVEHGH
jgi:F-type H+-transporting ATPase subunit epsilon